MSEDMSTYMSGTPAQEEVDKKISIGIEITASLQKALSRNLCFEDLYSLVRGCLECNPIDPESKPPMMHFAFSKPYRPDPESEENIIVNQKLRGFLDLPDRGAGGWYLQDEVVTHFAKRSFPENTTAQESVRRQSNALSELIQTLTQTTIRPLPHLLFTVTRNEDGVIIHSPLITYAFVITRNKKLVGVLYVSDRVHQAPLLLEKYERRVRQGFLVYPTELDFYKMSELAKIDIAEYDHTRTKAVQAVERSVKHGDDLTNSIFENYQEKKLASQKRNYLTEYKQSDRHVLLSDQKSELELTSGGEALEQEMYNLPSKSLGKKRKLLDGIAHIQSLAGQILHPNELTIGQLVELCNEIQQVPLPEDAAQRPEFKGCRDPKKHMDAYKIAALTRALQVVEEIYKNIENDIRNVQDIPQSKYKLRIQPVRPGESSSRGLYGHILISDRKVAAGTCITLKKDTASLFTHLFKKASDDSLTQVTDSSKPTFQPK